MEEKPGNEDRRGKLQLIRMEILYVANFQSTEHQEGKGGDCPFGRGSDCRCYQDKW